MNVLDFVLVAILAFSTVPAFIKGFVYEAVMLAAAVLAIGLANWWYRPLALSLRGWVSNSDARQLLAFLIILGGVLLAAMLVGRALSGLVHAAGLSTANRLLGAGLGVARGILICTVLLIILTAFPLNVGATRHSLLAPPLLSAGSWLVHLMPDDIRIPFMEGLRQVRHLPLKDVAPIAAGPDSPWRSTL